MTDEERSARAGEYVLGTLPADERAAFEAAMRSDPALEALVRGWEARLAGLATAVPPVPPPPGAWDAIAAATIGTRLEAAMPPPEAANDGVVLGLRRRVAAWRTATIAAAAIAAALAVVVVTGPSVTPDTGDQRYVAVVNRGGDLPALLVDVDLATGIIAVRSVAAEAPAGRSHELWYIAEGRDPLSLGVVDHVGEELVLSIADVADFEPTEAVFAITEEPFGGSPTGAPTGAVVFTGTLLPAPR